jgi:hypothetical protein
VLNVLSDSRRRSSTDANEHEYRRPLLWPEGHVALVYKSDRASGIERVGIENLLILLATRAADQLITGPCDNLDGRSVGAGSGTREISGTRRTSRANGTRRLRDQAGQVALPHPWLAARFVRRQPR